MKASANRSATETLITEPLLVAGDHCIERPHAGTVEKEGDGKPDGQHVVLESLALLVPVPVHEEALARPEPPRRMLQDQEPVLVGAGALACSAPCRVSGSGSPG